MLMVLLAMARPPAYLPEPAPPKVRLTICELVAEGMSIPEVPRLRFDGSGAVSGGMIPAASSTAPVLEVTVESSMLARTVLPS